MRILTIASILGFSATSAAQPPRRPAVTIDAPPLSERVRPPARKAAPATPTLPADKIMELQLLTTPIRAEQEAILVKLVESTPDSDPDKPDLLFRLAELYAQQHRTFRLQSIEADMRKKTAVAKQAGDRARQYLARAVTTYKALTDNAAFTNFARMDLALFVYAYTLQSAKYVTEARAVYDKLLKNYPASKYVPEAHFAFAEHYFESGKLDDAEARYKHVLRFPSSSMYWYAMYKLGWIQLNRAQFAAALETFYQITQATRSKQDLAILHRSAKQDYVRAYAEVGKVDKAHQAFKRVDVSGSLAMMERLADLLVEQGKSDKAIYTLRELMKLAPAHVNACRWQYEVALATLSLPGASNADKVREVQDLTRLHQAARLPAEQANDCRENATAMSGELARTYHAEWAKTKSADSLAAATKLYATYLAAFPTADDFARTRYFHAELLWSTQQWEAAALAFTEVVKGGKLEQAIINESAYAAVRAWMHAHENDPPASKTAVAEATTDEAPRPKPIPSREQQMLASFELYLEHTKSPPEDEVVHMKFLRANVLRRFDHLAAAAPMFREIVTRHPHHEIAEDAALLYVDSLVRLHDEPALIAATDELLANKSLVAGKPTLLVHLEKIKTTSLRRVAERVEKQARASKNLAGLVQCGQAYLAIYNRRPDAEDNDQVLWNAAVCFEDGRSVSAAIRMYQLLEKFYPSSKLAARATARLGKAYADLAFYDEAAATLERYAKKYAGEADAYDAMSEAVFFAKGTGDDAKAIENTRYFVKMFGAKKPVEAANAAFSLIAVYEKQSSTDALVRHLREYIQVHGARGGGAKLAIAHAKLGQVLFEQSCPVKEVDGTCIRVTRERAVAYRRSTRSARQRQCGPESALEVTVVERDPRLVRDALQQFALASKEYGKLPATAPEAQLARHYHAQGKLAEASVELERYLALAFPSNLDFDPKRPAIAKQSLARFDAWFAKKEAGAKHTSEKLAAVLAIKDPASSIAAAARLGQVTQNFSDALFTAEIPKDVRSGPYAEDKIEAYCDVLMARAEPLAARSLDAYGTCLAKSTELGWFSEWSKLCERELGQIKPEEFPTAIERRGDPDRVAVVTALEKAPALD